MKKQYESLLNALKAYDGEGHYPMHMPGHKRNSKLPSAALPWNLDITEIEGFDNLHNPKGILAKAQKRASALWNSKEAYFLVNGSTGGILAGIHAATSPGDKVLMARNCHKSVYHAVELMGLRPVFLEPNIFSDIGICSSILPEQVENALEAEPEIRLAVITSPTYEGVISDIEGIGTILHKKNIPLMVDEAHGAHLGLAPCLPSGALAAGADIVIHSLHKTLPSLTQTAIAHLQGDRVSAHRLRHSLSLFQTSSPSYLLMASIDSCVEDLINRGEEPFVQWQNCLSDFREMTADMRHLAIWQPHDAYGFDSSKIVISCKNSSLTGAMLAQRLRCDYKIEMEMALGGFALAMTSIADTQEGILKLAGALTELDLSCASARSTAAAPLPPMPRPKLSACTALRSPLMEVPFSLSEGEISGEYIWAYPPAIPLIIPGQVVSKELIAAVSQMSLADVELHSTFGCVPEFIHVVFNSGH